MGEVHRARDTRIERVGVAIKVLPDEVTPDSERLQRFERPTLAVSLSSRPAGALDPGRFQALAQDHATTAQTQVSGVGGGLHRSRPRV